MMARAVLPLFIWGCAIYYFGQLWQAFPDYHFGWIMPVLGLALFWERWQNRPAPEPPPPTALARMAFILSALTFSMGTWLLEVMPSWRFAGWLLALSLTSLTLLDLYESGGRAWLKHLAFPVCFFLVAIPWPTRLEIPLITQLSQLNALLSAGLANLIGIPCLRQGTVIETGAGTVGVDTACSGIRSLQATLMVALFLGELFRYPKWRRGLLVLGGAGLTLLGNVLRTSYLIRICDAQGTAGVQQHHDEAGLTVLGITLAGLLLLTWGLRPKPVNSPPLKRAEIPSAPGYPWGLWLGLTAWVLLSQSGMEYWFRSSETTVRQTPHWIFSPPRERAGYGEKDIPAATREMLKYDEGINAIWPDESGRPWELFYVRWLPASNRYRAAEATAQARGHAPDICLQNAGMILQTNYGAKILARDDVELRTTVERFDDHGRCFHVLAAYWEPQSQACYPGNSENPSTRLGFKLAWHAIRQHDRGRLEKRVIKIGVWDMPDDPTAILALEKCLWATLGFTKK